MVWFMLTITKAMINRLWFSGSAFNVTQIFTGVAAPPTRRRCLMPPHATRFEKWWKSLPSNCCAEGSHAHLTAQMAWSAALTYAAGVARSMKVTQGDLPDNCGLHNHRIEEIAQAIERGLGR
mgnify:CR=1 FL=1